MMVLIEHLSFLLFHQIVSLNALHFLHKFLRHQVTISYVLLPFLYLQEQHNNELVLNLLSLLHLLLQEIIFLILKVFQLLLHIFPVFLKFFLYYIYTDYLFLLYMNLQVHKLYYMPLKHLRIFLNQNRY